MYQDETHSESHLERTTPLPSANESLNAEVQRKRLLIALGILLAALTAVVLKDWDFWFPSSGEAQEAAVRTVHRSAPVAATAPAIAAAHDHKAAKPADTAPPADAPFSATTERAVLPPLQVEVVAGNRHIEVPAKTSAIHVDVGSGATSPAAASSPTVAASATTGPSGRVELSPQTAQNVTVSVPPDYPLLARQMKVQGVVSLQALISREGTIQELQILSGPGILAAAAREAVKQWHFKPYILNGQPVETQARITVNFTISTN
jgi:TonB family protein